MIEGSLLCQGVLTFFPMFCFGLVLTLFFLLQKVEEGPSRVVIWQYLLFQGIRAILIVYLQKCGGVFAS